MKFCTACGVALTAGKSFCSACGAAVVVGASSSAESAAPSVPRPVPPPSDVAPPVSEPAVPRVVAEPDPEPPVLSGPIGPKRPIGADSADRDPVVVRLQVTAVVVALVGVYVPWYRLPGLSLNAFELPAAFVVSFETNFRTVEIGTVVLVAIGVALASAVAPGVLHRTTLVSGVGLVVAALLFTVQTSRSISGSTLGLPDVLGLGPIAIAVAGALLIAARVRSGPSGGTGAAVAAERE